MPDLKWDEQDFLECLGVIPEIEEFSVSHSYKLAKDGLTLDITIWQHDSLVALSFAKEDLAEPFISLTLLIRDEIVFMNERNLSGLKFKDCILVPGNFWAVENGGGLFDKKFFPFSFDLDLWVYPKLELKMETI